MHNTTKEVEKAQKEPEKLLLWQAKHINEKPLTKDGFNKIWHQQTQNKNVCN